MCVCVCVNLHVSVMICQERAQCHARKKSALSLFGNGDAVGESTVMIAINLSKYDPLLPEGTSEAHGVFFTFSVKALSVFSSEQNLG